MSDLSVSHTFCSSYCVWNWVVPQRNQIQLARLQEYWHAVDHLVYTELTRSRSLVPLILCRWIGFFPWGEVRQSLLGALVVIGPNVPALDERWWWWGWSSRRNENWQRKPKYSKKTCPSATLSTSNPIWYDLGWNPGRRGGKPMTNRVWHGLNWHWYERWHLKLYLHSLCTHCWCRNCSSYPRKVHAKDSV
jgi:hypothetical protein